MNLNDTILRGNADQVRKMLEAGHVPNTESLRLAFGAKDRLKKIISLIHHGAQIDTTILPLAIKSLVSREDHGMTFDCIATSIRHTDILLQEEMFKLVTQIENADRMCSGIGIIIECGLKIPENAIDLVIKSNINPGQYWRMMDIINILKHAGKTVTSHTRPLIDNMPKHLDFDKTNIELTLQEDLEYQSSILEVKKNARMIELLVTKKYENYGFFATLTNELNFKIIALTGDPKYADANKEAAEQHYWNLTAKKV